MGKSSKAPDPIPTATAQQHLNQVNQNGPFANLNYSQTGTNADGTPQMTGTTNLSPQLQSLYSQVGQPNSALDPNNLQKTFGQQQGKAYDASMSYLQPQFDQQSQGLTDKLSQQGITQQSNPTAYANAMQLNNNSQSFARQQALDSSYSQGLAGSNQQFNQGVTASNLPISQLSTLYGMSNQNGQGNSNTLAQLEQNKASMDNATANNNSQGTTAAVEAAAMAAIYMY